MRGSYVPRTERDIDRFIDTLDELPDPPDEIPGRHESIESITRSLANEARGRVQRSSLL